MVTKRGRPRSEEAMRGQCNVRIGEYEQCMLDKLEGMTGKKPPDIFRDALQCYYLTKLEEMFR